MSTPTIPLAVAAQVLNKRREWLSQRIEIAAKAGKLLAHDRLEVEALVIVLDYIASTNQETSS